MNKQYVIDLVANMLDGNPTNAQERAEMIVERLQEEGVLHLGHGTADVDMIVEKFSETFGNTRTSKYDRFAANRLASKYGSQAVIGIIGLLGSLSQEKYAPVVNSVSELESKFVSVVAFLRKTGTDNVTIEL